MPRDGSKDIKSMNIYLSRVSELLEKFPEISLSQMDSIRLMNRIDSKYLTDSATVYDILQDALRCGYRVFTQESRRLHDYDSIYFDTADLRMFTDHRRGKADRQKVRTRSYVGTGQCYLEVKRKNNHGRTRKKRIPLDSECFHDFHQSSRACSWLEDLSAYPPESLSASLETSFYRITLVNSALTERLTIDLDVKFHNFRTLSPADLGQAVIIELKQDGRLHSQMQDILLSYRVKKERVSKYCIGIALSDQSVLPGRFKLKIRQIEKINKNTYLKCYNPVILQPL